MEHDLLIMKTGVDGLCPRLAMSDIQAPSESGRETGKGKIEVLEKWRSVEEKVERKVGIPRKKKKRRRSHKDEQSDTRSGTPGCATTESARSIRAHPSPTGRQGHRGCPLHHNVSGGTNARPLGIGFFQGFSL